MFNRDRVPGLPGSSPRPPQRNDGYGQPPPQQQPPRGYDPRMGGYENRPAPGYGAPPPGGQRMPARAPQGGGGGGGPARQLRPIKSPGGNAYAFGNLYVFEIYSQPHILPSYYRGPLSFSVELFERSNKYTGLRYLLKTSNQTPTAPISISSSTETSLSLRDLRKGANQEKLVLPTHKEHGPEYHLALRRSLW